MVEKTCMNCGTIGCDHKDARRCSNGHYLWTPKLSEIEQLRQRVQELEKQRDELIEVKAAENASWNAGFNVQADQIKKLTAERDELLNSAEKLITAMSGTQAESDFAFQMCMLEDAIASVKEK